VSSLQQRLLVITDAELAAIASAAHLKSQLSELEGLAPALIWKAATINLPAAGF